MASGVRRLLREPLLWFLLAGGLIFLAEDWWSGLSDRSRTIEISEGQIRSLVDRWSMQMGKPPTERELAALIDDHVREEVLYREALRIGLDRGDTIIRRRLAQKMSFLIEDSLLEPDVSAEALAAYHTKHIEAYTEPARYTFTQVYFRGEDAGSGARVQASLAQLNAGAEPGSLGDPFMLQRSYAHRSSQEVERLFGKQFAGELTALPADGSWYGPIASSYGQHVVLLERKEDAVVPPLEAVIDRVREDFVAEQLDLANERRFREIRARYEILLPGDAGR